MPKMLGWSHIFVGGMNKLGYVHNALTGCQLHRVVMGLEKGDGKGHNLG